jgi:hypothetical protein
LLSDEIHGLKLALVMTEQSITTSWLEMLEKGRSWITHHHAHYDDDDGR